MENKQVVTGLYYSRIIASFYNVASAKESKERNNLVFAIFLRSFRFNDWGIPDESNGRYLTKQEVLEIEDFMTTGKLEIERYVETWMSQFKTMDTKTLIDLYVNLDDKMDEREGAE